MKRVDIDIFDFLYGLRTSAKDIIPYAPWRAMLDLGIYRNIEETISELLRWWQ